MSDIQKMTVNDQGATVEITRVTADSFTVNAVRAPDNVNITMTAAEIQALADLCIVAKE